MTDKNTLFAQCADLLGGADSLLITAGAGMGVDSGLPDFRGNDGFWKAYPALADAGMRFEAIASPAAFESQPRRAWGFYGHRLELYRRTVPPRRRSAALSAMSYSSCRKSVPSSAKPGRQ